MASVFGVEELYQQTVAVLEGLGSELDHAFGAEHIERHKLPNSYVWVPTKSRENRKATPRGGAFENRTIFGTEEHFEIHCWGESFAAAYAMRQNVVHAMVKAIGGTASLHLFDSDWLDDDKTDETVLGRTLIARFWIDAAIPDAYIPLERFVRKTSQTVADALIPSTVPTAVEIETSSAADIDDDSGDEVAATDTVTE